MSETIKASIEIPKPSDGWDFVGYAEAIQGDKVLCGTGWLDNGTVSEGIRGLIARKRKTVAFTEWAEAVVMYLCNHLGFHETKSISGTLDVDTLLHNRGAKHGSRWIVKAAYTLEEVTND